MISGNCFVPLNGKKQRVDKCPDVDDVLQNVIESLCASDDSESDDSDIQ